MDIPHNYRKNFITHAHFVMAFFVSLPLDSGSYRLIGNPVKIRGYARSCKFQKTLPARMSLIFFIGKTSEVEQARIPARLHIRSFREQKRGNFQGGASTLAILILLSAAFIWNEIKI